MVDEDSIITSLSQIVGIHTNLHIKEGLFGEYLPYPPSLVSAVLLISKGYTTIGARGHAYAQRISEKSAPLRPTLHWRVRLLRALRKLCQVSP
jgi:hypothetical protein